MFWVEHFRKRLRPCLSEYLFPFLSEYLFPFMHINTLAKGPRQEEKHGVKSLQRVT